MAFRKHNIYAPDMFIAIGYIHVLVKFKLTLFRISQPILTVLREMKGQSFKGGSDVSLGVSTGTTERMMITYGW